MLSGPAVELEESSFIEPIIIYSVIMISIKNNLLACDAAIDLTDNKNFWINDAYLFVWERRIKIQENFTNKKNDALL